ncbi:MAG: hypothetical protein N4A63_17320 [Vallitalea sp.]|jgi:hypothetical protein|nr:hypothetical protein [Vallitalea sp.]
MEYANNLYKSKEISEKKYKKIVKKVRRRKRVRGIYFLTCIEESKNPLEILTSAELYKTINKNNKILIIGIADSKEHSFELVRMIYDDVYKKTSDVDLSILS